MHSLFIIIYKTAVSKFPPLIHLKYSPFNNLWRPRAEPNGSWSALLRSWSPRPLWLHASCRCRHRSETHTPEMMATVTSAARPQSPSHCSSPLSFSCSYMTLVTPISSPYPYLTHLFSLLLSHSDCIPPRQRWVCQCKILLFSFLCWSEPSARAHLSRCERNEHELFD